MSDSRDDLAAGNYLALTTFRRNGDAVTTPVWVVGLDDGRLGFWTSSKTGKVKRLAHTAAVTVQPSDARGRPSPGSEPVSATATVESHGAAFDEVTAKVKAKYGVQTVVTKLIGKLTWAIRRRESYPYADRVVVVSIDG